MLSEQFLDLRQDQEDWSRWSTIQPLTFQRVIVPSGFHTDGASVPRILWWILPSWDRYGKAAVIHDWCYDRLRVGHPAPAVYTRRDADALFYDAMVETGVNTTVRWIMWAAVRLFGWMSL